jgi:glycosyltransferase involved in cell wall biosynthesis
LKKILLITYYWPPSGGAGVQRPLKFAKYLSQAGFEVHVLTVDPTKASYPVTDSSLISEIPESITIHYSNSFEPLNLLGAFISKKKIPYGGFANTEESFFQKTLRYIRGNFFIPDARIGWVRFAEKKAAEIISKEGISNVIISSPPHSSQLIGLRLKKKFQFRWLADLRDPWTDIYYYKELLHTPSSAEKDKAFEREILEQADEIIAVSSPINKTFLSKSSKLSAEKFHVIPNGFEEENFKLPAIHDKEVFRITYVGTMAETYKPLVFFEVFREVMSMQQSINIRLRFVGSVADSVKKQLQEANLIDQVEIIPTVMHSKAVSYMQESDMLLLAIPDTPGNEGILTGKLFEYLATRNPIIGLGPVKGEAAVILTECSAGKMFERSEKQAMINYLNSVILRWKSGEGIENKSDMFFKYSRKELTDKLIAIINK